MLKSKYSTFLTVILIIAIIAIIAIVAVLGVNVYKDYENEKEAKKTIAQLQEGNIVQKPEDVTNEVIEDNIVIEPVIGNTTGNVTGNNTTQKKVKFHKNYPMAGYIKIEKTGIEYPILLDISPAALETAVGVMYPTNPELNKPGNVVIIGHNYRNGKFFSDNKKLVTGDKIEITDLTGKTLKYTIYEIFETTQNDTEYITRERGDNIEISLSTCTDDGNRRLVILAKVN